MKTQTLNFLESLLFNAEGGDNPHLNDKTVYDFTPAFINAAEKFIDGFRAHLEQTGFPVGKLLNAERSFGGNVYWSLSGAGVGFFDGRHGQLAPSHVAVPHAGLPALRG